MIRSKSSCWKNVSCLLLLFLFSLSRLLLLPHVFLSAVCVLYVCVYCEHCPWLRMCFKSDRIISTRVPLHNTHADFSTAPEEKKRKLEQDRTNKWKYISSRSTFYQREFWRLKREPVVFFFSFYFFLLFLFWR